MVLPSSLVCSFSRGGLGCFQMRASTSAHDVLQLILPTRSSLSQSKRARLDEHRLCNNTIGLVCAFGEQRRSTALTPSLSGVSRSASTRTDQAAPLLSLGEQRRRTASHIPPFWCARWASKRSCPSLPIRYFAESSSDRIMQFIQRRSGGRPSTFFKTTMCLRPPSPPVRLLSPTESRRHPTSPAR